MLKKRGQSTLEYVVALTAVIAVVVAFAAGVLRTNMQNSLEHVANEMGEVTNRIDF